MEITFSLRQLLQFLHEKQWIADVTLGQEPGFDMMLTGFSSIYETKPNTLSWMNAQALDWSSIMASVVICSQDALCPKDTPILFIPVKNPRNTFASVMYAFCPKNTRTGISPTAVIGEGCTLGQNVYIGHHVVLGDHVKIGDNTQIHSNVTIYDHTTVGSNCVIHSGVVIGGDGFGYERDENGDPFKFPHIGSVVIGDHVEIGCNTCIARGVLANTVISEHVKIGNLSHISHNVVVGKNAMITHQTHVSGSNNIGSNCWIAPGVVLKEGLSIGEHAVLGLGAVVLRHVHPHDVVAGVPAASLKKKSGTPMQHEEEEN